MTEDPHPEAVLHIPVAELDAILEDVRPGGQDIDDPMQAGHHAGQVRGAETMHRELIDAAEITLDTPDTE